MDDDTQRADGLTVGLLEMNEYRLLQSPVRFSQIDRGASTGARRNRWNLGAVSVFGLMAFLWGSLPMHGQTTMSEYQVKALFLLNFVKYVDWPAGAMLAADSPIVIGVMGQDNFNDSLTSSVDGKSFKGRSIVIKHFSIDDDLSGCAILFLSSSTDSQLGAILKRTGALPILTVGEDDSFLQKGGIIDFMLKDGKIHLAINLRAAQKVKLQISSKLLSVAEVVRE